MKGKKEKTSKIDPNWMKTKSRKQK